MRSDSAASTTERCDPCGPVYRSIRAPAVRPATPVISSTPRAYSSSAARSEAAMAAARRAGSSSSPSSSAASSSRGTSLTVHGSCGDRASSSRSRPDRRGPAAARTRGSAHRSAMTRCGVSGIQHRFTSRRTSGLSRRSPSRISRLESGSTPRASASTTSSRSSREVTKVSRALLCGLREERARSRAALTIAGGMTILVPATVSWRAASGMRWRLRMAVATTSAMRRSPLIRATESSASGSASTPGKS